VDLGLLQILIKEMPKVTLSLLRKKKKKKHSQLQNSNKCSDDGFEICSIAYFFFLFVGLNSLT
jgi:hypothetical protein